MAMQSLILGDVNLSAISTGTNQAQAIAITHNNGADFTITGFLLQFATGQESAQARIFDAQNNRDMVSPNTPIGLIGKVKNLNSILPFVSVQPYVIKSGQTIFLFITNNIGSTIAIRDLGFALFGYQVV